MALAIAGFCLLAILGLLQTGLTSERATIEQTAASGIITRIFGDLAATPSTNTSSSDFGVDLAAPNTKTLWFTEGGATNSSAAGSRFRATVAVLSTNSPIPVRLRVTWPAAADPDLGKQAGCVEVVTTLER